MKITLRILSIILAFAILCSACLVSGMFATALSNRHGYINGSDVNIRTGAGISNTSLGKLQLNTPVLVTGVAFDSNGTRWYKLTAYTSSGDIDGYVSANYVTVTGSDNICEATVVADTSVRVRSAPGTNNTIITELAAGTNITAIGSEYASNGKLWYHIRFTLDGETVTGYMHSDYVQLIPEYEEDKDFEEHLTEQGFPESYKEKLRQLHTLYPNWLFIADKLDMSWDEAVAGETELGRSLVSSSSSASWKSMEEEAYNWSLGYWNGFDGESWVEAADSVVRYYLDPRNFLTATGVFQFISMKYDPVLNTKESLQSALNGTFMAGKFPESAYNTYADILMDAAKQTGVSPIALASMIIVEQGTDGSGKSISGSYSGYEGYYNYFNIGASASGGKNAIQNGLEYAKKADATYDRPWNTRTKSILGGAKFYASTYIKRGQSTLYYKKFNVVYKPYFSSQYMTNIQGAASEASKTASGYKDIMNSKLIFNIPVYKNMPETIAPYPTTTGNNDCYLSDISLNGYSYTPTFDRYTNNYEIIVSGEVKEIVVTPVASADDSTVEGGGRISLKEGYNDIAITVTSSSGLKNTYTVSVFREEYEEEIADPVINGNIYKIEGNKIFGIKPSTTKEVFITNLNVEGGTMQIINSTDSLVKTGDVVEIRDSSGTVRYTYTLVVKGDVNCDGKLSLVDLSLLKRHLLYIEELEGNSCDGADVNYDGNITLLDLSLIKRRLLQIDIW
ncbi:MAG: SH3 domain-containing protein [Acutalibacteraceae bacterium]|nr:SH3 domain-containing protein [Acutalibacteraceae bacterium]